MPSPMDWILLIVFLILLALVYLQGKDIDRIEQIMRIQNDINENLNKQLEQLKMGKNWVGSEEPPISQGIDDGFLLDPRKPR